MPVLDLKALGSTPLAVLDEALERLHGALDYQSMVGEVETVVKRQRPCVRPVGGTPSWQRRGGVEDQRHEARRICLDCEPRDRKNRR